MKLSIFLLTLCLLGTAKADVKHEIVLNAVTAHLVVLDGQELNQDNFGIGYQNETTEFGTFINSIGERSWYVGKRRKYGEKISLNTGIIKHPDFPIYVSATYDADLFQIGIGPNVIFLQLKYEVK